MSFTLFALLLFVSPTLTLRLLELGGLTGWGKVIITEEIWFERLVADSGFDIDLVITWWGRTRYFPLVSGSICKNDYFWGE